MWESCKGWGRSFKSESVLLSSESPALVTGMHSHVLTGDFIMVKTLYTKCCEWLSSEPRGHHIGEFGCTSLQRVFQAGLDGYLCPLLEGQGGSKYPFLTIQTLSTCCTHCLNCTWPRGGTRVHKPERWKEWGSICVVTRRTSFLLGKELPGMAFWEGTCRHL